MKKNEKISLSSDKLDPPGLLGDLFVVPIFKDRDLGSDEDRLKDKSIRKFEVVAALGKQPLQAKEISISVDEEDGDSYIIAHPNAAVTKLYAPEGEIYIEHNQNRELARAKLECRATSAQDARNKFIKGFTPYLDHVSYLANIPIFITQIYIHDKKQEIQSAYYFSPYKNVQVNPHKAELSEDLIPVYALYREAKNSASPFYRFLCYFKILEGIYSVLRPDVFMKAKQAGKTVTTKKEVVPDTEYIRERFPEVIGKPIKEVFDRRFQPEFRNKVAHYLLDNKSPANLSDFALFSEFGSELGLIETCSRIVIETHSEYIKEIR